MGWVLICRSNNTDGGVRDGHGGHEQDAGRENQKQTQKEYQDKKTTSRLSRGLTLCASPALLLPRRMHCGGVVLKTCLGINQDRIDVTALDVNQHDT